MIKRSISSINQLSNETFVVCVLYLLLQETGSNKIHTEEIAYKCFQLLPEKFRWQLPSKQHLPDMEPARRGLMDARSKHNWVYGHKSKDATKSGWSLTDIGYEIAKNNIYLFDSAENITAGNQNNSYILSYLSRIKQTDIYKNFLDNKLQEIQLSEVAKLLETGLNIQRINEKFFTTFNYAQTYDNNEALLELLIFIQEYFPQHISREIQIKENLRTSKAKNKME
ncbi:MAG: hypothetical protein ACJ0BR_06320 [Candidatus Puniceispirillales bacterium]